MGWYCQGAASHKEDYQADLHKVQKIQIHQISMLISMLNAKMCVDLFVFVSVIVWPVMVLIGATPPKGSGLMVVSFKELDQHRVSDLT